MDAKTADDQRLLQPDLFDGIAAPGLPCPCHVQRILEWLVRMRGRAWKACFGASVTDDNLVDDVFDPGAAWSDHGHELGNLRHLLSCILTALPVGDTK